MTKAREGEPVDEDAIKNTVGLFRASLDDALLIGGEVTKYALSLMNFRQDRKHIVVDTKIHMLMPGFCPAIPGWHTDGVPRLTDLSDKGTANIDFGQPCIELQEQRDDYHRYHIASFGLSTTKFVDVENIDIPIPDGPNHNLYRDMSRYINENDIPWFQMDPYTVYEFDWWRVHAAPVAERREWRFLIRVTESNDYTPKTLEHIVRRQSQVYIPQEYGW